MCIRSTIVSVLLVCALSHSAEAADGTHDHGGMIFHGFRLETDFGKGKEGPVKRWNLDGWMGGDYDKLWLKSEGENYDGSLEQAEFWAMYSRNVSDFWDVQAGIRHDTQPESINYLVLGVNGLAPYFFETEAHIFLSDDGDVTARVHAENDFLLTQRLVLQPYAELNLSAQDIQALGIGSGFTDAEIGLQTRYEITRKFAPYADARYERSFGGEEDDFIGSIGLRLMF